MSGKGRWWAPGASGALMVCGTTSDAGKSVVVQGLCAALRRQGVKVAPFKGQNMSLNSYVCDDGAEISRAQAAQAMAAGATPDAMMNPVLLKPTGDSRSQLVVMGKVAGELDSAGLQAAKADLAPIVDAALADLRSRYDVVLCEGAGSPAEINLPGPDLVNLGLASRAGIGSMLVADIERGGAFAAIEGTLSLLPPAERRGLGGVVVNKMRGDASLLAPGISQLEQRWQVPFLGILPHLGGTMVDQEDSLALRFGGSPARRAVLDVAVVALPRISNFTDFEPLAAEEGVALRYVASPGLLGRPDLVILPGSKATVADLGWLRSSGMAAAVVEAYEGGSSLAGICGGYQMMGKAIYDGVESAPACTEGLGLLDATTRFCPEKVTRRRQGRMGSHPVSAYQIHHGRVAASESPWFTLEDGEEEGCATPRGLWGTTLHGLFENDGARGAFLAEVAARAAKAWQPSGLGFEDLRRRTWERLADTLEAHLDLGAVAEIMGRGPA